MRQKLHPGLWQRGVILVLILLSGTAVRAADMVALVNDQLEAGTALADTIWRHAEMGYLEEQSSARPRLPGGFQALERREFGDTAMHFFRFGAPAG